MVIISMEHLEYRRGLCDTLAMLTKTRHFWLVVLVLLVGATVFSVLIRHGPKSAPLQITPAIHLVETFPAHYRDVTPTITGWGEMTPPQTWRVRASVKGVIQKMHPAFHVGGMIPAHAVILEIDREPYLRAVTRQKYAVQEIHQQLEQMALEQSADQAHLELEQQAVQLAKSSWKRLSDLVHQGAATPSQRDEAEAQWLSKRSTLLRRQHQLDSYITRRQQMTSRYQRAREQLLQFQKELKETRIHFQTPVRVLHTDVSEGQWIRIGEVLGTVYNPTVMEAQVALTPSRMALLFEQPENPNLESMTADVIWSHGKQSKLWKGRIVEVSGALNTESRMPSVTVRIDPKTGKDANSSFPLKGMFVQVSIHGRSIPNVVALPRRLIRKQQQVAVEKSGRLLFRTVSVAAIVEDVALVKNGLHEGEAIIKTYLPGAYSGMRVTVNASAKTVHVGSSPHPRP